MTYVHWLLSAQSQLLHLSDMLLMGLRVREIDDELARWSWDQEEGSLLLVLWRGAMAGYIYIYSRSPEPLQLRRESNPLPLAARARGRMQARGEEERRMATRRRRMESAERDPGAAACTAPRARHAVQGGRARRTEGISRGHHTPPRAPAIRRVELAVPLPLFHPLGFPDAAASIHAMHACARMARR